VTKEDLVSFEEEIKQLFLEKKIRAPVHLSFGSEEHLIRVFENVGKDDWVFSTHRNHYHALLKGLGREWLKNEILHKRSMHIYSKEHKFFTSAIVGGVLPIAVGVAMALKRKKSRNKVWVFVGDMASEMGVFHECVKYASRQDLPIVFVVEDNGLSADAPTQKVWGLGESKSKVIRFGYVRQCDHVGVGQWVTF